MGAVSAYVPLLTLLQLLDTLKLRSRYRLTLVDYQQTEYLEEQVLYFLEFLEIRLPGPDDPEIKPFVLEIHDSVLSACEVVDFHVVDQIRQSPFDSIEEGGDNGWLSTFSEDLIKVIRDLESIRCKIASLAPATQPSSIPYPSTSSMKGNRTKVVGFEHHISCIKDELGTSHVRSREVIPIVGMGGIGKTTLTWSVYEDRYIQRRFDKRCWVSVSLEYDLLRILQGILGKKNCDSVRDLGTELYQTLKGWKYLIVLDDMWDISAWEDLRQYFPDDNQGSRIIVTTRNSQLAASLGSYKAPYNVGFLDEEKSWELFCDRVFGGMCCLPELETFGKQIVDSCRGLPLGIVTIAGLLSKSDKTSEHWSSVSKDVASFVNLEDNEYCRKVLNLSYDNLPLHLKPVFLYIGGFYEEDEKIHMDGLIRSLVALAMVRPLPHKPIHHCAMDSLVELLQRNLIFIRDQDPIPIGQVVSLGVHDLLRDLCLKEISHEKLFDGFINQDGCTKCMFSAKRSFYLGRDTRHIRFCGSCKELHKSEGSHCSMFWNMRYFSDYAIMIRELPLLVSEIWNSPQLESIDLVLTTFTLNERKNHIILEQLVWLVIEDGTGGAWMREIANAMPNLKDLTLCRVEGSNTVTLPPLLERLKLVKAQDIEYHCFPQSLRELHLEQCRTTCSHVNEFGHALPNLEKLTVSNVFLVRCDDVWKPIEGGFRRLKCLDINGEFCRYWRSGSDIHFPQLQTLTVMNGSMDEIPRGLRTIGTLVLIYFFGCTTHVRNRLRWILKQQRLSGNDQLRLIINGEEEDDDEADDDDDDNDDCDD